MLKSLFKPRPAVEAGRALFKALAAQARQPVFYARFGAPDTVEGRFEVYVMHLVLVLHRLKGEGQEAAETAQAAFDTFLKNLEDGLREMGVGDLSVGKKMRKLGEAVYGRIKSYDKAFAEAVPEMALADVIRRTVLEAVPGASPEPFARYTAASAQRLAAQPLAAVLSAQLDWAEPRHD